MIIIIIILCNIYIKKEHLIQTRKAELDLVINKNRTCHRVDFVVTVNHRVKVGEGEKLDKYLDCAKEEKSFLNQKETVIPVIVTVLETMSRNQEKRLDQMCVD